MGEIIGSFTWRLNLHQSCGTCSEEKLTVMEKWMASTVKGVCCKYIAFIKHVDLNILLLHQSLTTVELFPQEAEIVRLMNDDTLSPGYHFPHFISLSLTFLKLL